MEEDLKDFLEECYENLDRLDQDLLGMEKNPDSKELMDRIFRTFHTIKASSVFLEFSKLEGLAHAAESLLAKFRAEGVLITSDVTSVFLAVEDAIRTHLASVEKNLSEGDADFSALIERLNALTHKVNAMEPETAPTETLADSETAPSETGASADTSIRVNVQLLDKLMDLVGELILTRNQIMQFTNIQENTAFNTAAQGLSLITTELQEQVMKTRMQPIGNIWMKFPRMARDIAQSSGKKIKIDMKGADTDLDKTIIEAIKDPLTHLMRNSIDHGIEPPSVRTQRNKPVEGHIILNAFHEGGQVNIEIADDGDGINLERVKQKAVEKNMISQEQAGLLSDREAMHLIFQPGFSTAKHVTSISGRGVGMDVVKTNIEKIGGTVDVVSRIHQGTTFRIKIPLTLAIIPALVVRSGGDRYAIPQVNLLELVRLENEAARKGIEMLHGAPVYRLRGNLLPLVFLNHELQIHEEDPLSQDALTERLRSQMDTVNMVILQADNRQFGVVVDQVNNSEDIVVKPLSKQLKHISIFSGATVMGDGKVALILDVLGLAQRASVISEEQRKSSLQENKYKDLDGSSTEHADDDELKQLLLFIGPGGERMAIPLDMVLRLEAFPLNALEYTGGQEVIQYRDKIMKLVRLADVFNVNDEFESLDTQEERETFHAVVVKSTKEGSLGIIVERILDIVEEAISVKGVSSREGVLFSTVVHDVVTEVLDLDYIIQRVEEDKTLRRRSTKTTKTTRKTPVKRTTSKKSKGTAASKPRSRKSVPSETTI